MVIRCHKKFKMEPCYTGYNGPMAKFVRRNTFADKEIAHQVYAIVVDALPNDEWCRLSEMEDQGINGYVESKVLEYSEE